MGRSGDLLRKMGKQSAKYVFTGEQLEEHDRLVAKAVIEQRQRELEMQVDKHVDEVIRNYATEDMKTDLYKVLLYALSVSCKVLIEKFGWTPTKRKIDERMRIVRFTRAVEAELEEIAKYSDLKSYSDHVDELYGVGWIAREE